MKKTISNLLLSTILVPVISFADTNSFFVTLNENDVSTVYGMTTGILVVFGEQDLSAVCQIAKAHDAHVSWVTSSKTDDNFQPIDAVECNASKK